MFTKLSASVKRNLAICWSVLIMVAIAIFALGFSSQAQGQLGEFETRSDKWGAIFQSQHRTWLKTQETDFKTKHLGSVKESGLDARPDMVILWAGYPFSKDYSSPRGHMYAIDYMRVSMRTGTPVKDTDGPLPATCWSCKSFDVIRMMNQYSEGGTKDGATEFFKKQWGALGPEIVNPIGCGSCHNPQDMSLQVKQPALIDAFKRRGGDVSKEDNNHMRSLVCAQCHVEYFFQAPNRTLTFPWDKGFAMEDMEKVYDEAKFADWTHAVSKAPMLKAQHPDYELHMMGTHGMRGVSCADCHMPKTSDGKSTFSDHQIGSPLRNIKESCQSCHADRTEAELRKFVEFNQDRVLEIRNRVEPELAKAHLMAKAAWDNGATEAEMAPILQLIRQAQWRWDYGVASHGASFHAPVETQRILAMSLDKTYQAQIELNKVLTAHNATFVMPDVSTRAKASALIGLDLAKLRAEKAEWLKTVVPQWLDKAKAAGNLDPQVHNTTVYPK
ncbi:MAG: ammonia-forming cytochrome c nitrite reductase subunit c552 [Saezia sp.]